MNSGYSSNRYSRRDDDRIKNLPNRLRNKRNEEIGQQSVGGASIDRSDKEGGASDSRKDSGSRLPRQQQQTQVGVADGWVWWVGVAGVVFCVCM